MRVFGEILVLNLAYFPSQYITQIVPYFISAPTSGISHDIVLPKDQNRRNLTLAFRSARKNVSTLPFWTANSTRLGANSFITSDGIEFIVLVDRSFPAALSVLSSMGIIGIYVSVVFVIHRFLRGIFGDTTYRIMFEELPSVDKILTLCKDIYLVRENNLLDLEEDLFGKLMFLFRSPETLIKWTKAPKRDKQQ